MPASAGCKLGKFAAFQYHSSTSLFKARKGPFDLHKWNLSNIYILSYRVSTFIQILAMF